MSDLTRGVIGMPFKLAMGSEMSRRQFHACAQDLLSENEELRKDVERLDWLGGTLGSIDIVRDQIDAAMALEKQA